MLKDMAKVLLVDALASEQENDDSETVLHKVESLISSGCDLMDTVPLVFEAYGVILDKAIDELVPEMGKLVKAVDKTWAGKLTMAELATYFGNDVYTTIAMTSRGMGVALDDDRAISNFLKERDCAESVYDIYQVSEMAIINAVAGVEDALAAALSEESEAE